MFTLKQALEAIKNKPEFSVKEREFGTVIDYMVSMKDTFVGSTPEETLILQNLRGTCFNDNGDIIRLAYHKFHNLNENEEYHESKFDFSEPHTIQEKLDGSMIAPIPNFGRMNAGWEFGTRAGHTDVSAKAHDLMRTWQNEQPERYEAYQKFIDGVMRCNMTPIFEFCSRAQRIVIDYPEPKLVLTGVRCNVSGRYIQDLRRYAVSPLIDVVRKQIGYTELKELAKEVGEMLDQEGVVVKFEDGRFVKIKAADYVLKHRALDGLKFEKHVLKLILLNEVDDVLPLVTPEVRKRLEDYRESVLNRVTMAQNEMLGCFERLSHIKEKKMFAELVKDSPYRNGLFKLYDGKDYLIKDYVLSKCGSATAVEEVRWIIGRSYSEF
jgi:RNA ligase